MVAGRYGVFDNENIAKAFKHSLTAFILRLSNSLRSWYLPPPRVAKFTKFWLVHHFQDQLYVFYTTAWI